MTDEELARKSAEILGQASGAARALADLDRLRARGKRAQIIDDHRRSRWLVFELPPQDSAALRNNVQGDERG
jgi:hypothetical protein